MEQLLGLFCSNSVERVDPEIATIIVQEQRRQKEGLELIASEN